MKKLFYLMLICNFLVLNGYSQSVTRLLATSPYDDLLRVLDTNNYALISSKTLTISTGTFDGSTGLARKPNTGIFYIVAKTSSSRYLGTLDPITGAVSPIGDLQDNFAQITFNGNNTLLGVTGTGANNPAAVYRINVLNANKTFVNNVNGIYGESICYNPANNKVYQWTGGYPYKYRRYDTTFTTFSNITPVNSTYEVTGSVYKANGKFVTFDLDNDFLFADTVGLNNGAVSYPDVLKGLAYITCSRTITASSASVCSNGAVTLTMSSTPGAGLQWYKNNVAIPFANSSTLSIVGGGYFKCMIDDGCGQDSLAPGKNIALLPTPVVSITGTTSICQGASTQLVGSSGGSSQWYQNGVLLNGSNTNSLIVNSPGVYNMVKTNLNGCKDSAAIGKVITVLPSPTVTVASTFTAICIGKSTTVTASGADTFTWNTGAATSTIAVSPTVTTTYTATGINLTGCFNYNTITLNVNALPSVSISASAFSICAGESATLTGMGAGSYTWDSGSNLTSIVVSPTVTTSYSVSGTDVNSCGNNNAILLDVDMCLGINSLSLKPGAVKIYPNPSSGNITIESPDAIKTIEVIDVTGRVVLKKNGQNLNSCDLDLSSLNEAVYTVRVNRVSGNISNSKITISK